MPTLDIGTTRLAISPHNYTVAEAVNGWLGYGLNGASPKTIAKCGFLVRGHIIPALGARKLRELSAEDIDRWLADKAKVLSTRTLREVYSWFWPTSRDRNWFWPTSRDGNWPRV